MRPNGGRGRDREQKDVTSLIVGAQRLRPLRKNTLFIP
jgi:hypothetical protein